MHGYLIGVLLCKGLQLGQGLCRQGTLVTVQRTRGVEDVLHQEGREVGRVNNIKTKRR
jgi:hypothetical protein